MRLLLDTHIWLWSLLEPERVAKRVSESLQDSATERWLSPVSTWEASLLIAKGRIQVPAGAKDWLSIATSGLREAPLTHEIVIAAASSPLTHSDPADRFLVATAQLLNLILVTADQRILALRDIQTLPNR